MSGCEEEVEYSSADGVASQLGLDVRYAAMVRRLGGPVAQPRAQKPRTYFAAVRGYGLFLYRTPDMTRAPPPVRISLRECYLELPRAARKTFCLRSDSCEWRFEVDTEEDVAQFCRTVEAFCLQTPPQRCTAARDEAKGPAGIDAAGADKRLRGRRLGWFGQAGGRGHNRSFGTPLGSYFRDRPAQQTVPLVVAKCIAEVARRGVDEVGIYRQAGSKIASEALRVEFDQDDSAVDLADSKWDDIHCVSSCLKQYFRDLPDGILGSVSDAFTRAGQIADDRLRVRTVAYLAQYQLQERAFATLAALMQHLSTVAAAADTNKMTADNLAIVFAPSLFAASNEDPDYMMAAMGPQRKVVETMIAAYAEIFTVPLDPTDFEAQAACSLAPQVSSCRSGPTKAGHGGGPAVLTPWVAVTTRAHASITSTVCQACQHNTQTGGWAWVHCIG